MTVPPRWDYCVTHYDNDVQSFLSDYFGAPDCRILFVAAAGFDPRAVRIASILPSAAIERIRAVLIREERPLPDGELVRRAETNLATFNRLIPQNTVEPIQVFDSDGAVIGGQRAASLARSVSLAQTTDIIIDLSAMSKGIAFPLVRSLYELVISQPSAVNLHLLVHDAPLTDDAIVAISSDKAAPIHGFRGGFGLSQFQRSAKLWLPQLATGQRPILRRIFETVSPHEVCPVLPFPAVHPRRGDELIEHFAEEFESVWDVDARNIVYAMENRPLDLYRTILRISEARKRVFAGVHGSQTILSPVGSKVLAIGALMAAMERDFPVIHVEAINYSVNYEVLDKHNDDAGTLAHVWLHGDVAA